MRTFRVSASFILLAMVLLVAVWSSHAFAGNIDPGNDGSAYAYGENVGWINLNPSNGGVTVFDSALYGYAWGENVGWVNFNCLSSFSCLGVSYKVLNDGAGNLSGYAWGENIGWINFAPTDGGVVIDPATGVFHGKAYGENIGWVSFDSNGPVPFAVATSWRGVVNQPPSAIGRAVTAMEDTPLAFDLFGFDPEGAPLTFSTATPPMYGTLNWTPSPVYTPDPDFFGYDYFTFQVSDGVSSSAPAEVTITVLPMNDPPVLDAIGNKTVAEGQNMIFVISGSDPDGDTLTYTVEGVPPWAGFDPYTHTFSWMPDYTQAGQYHVIFTVSAGTWSDSEDVTITVNNTTPDTCNEEWVYTGSLGTGRRDHTATLLNDGRVLVTGGDNDGYPKVDGGLFSAELYDPVTGIFSATGSMSADRYYHTATRLPDGKVLVAGGDNNFGGAVSTYWDGGLASSELYNPATGTFTGTGSMRTARFFHTATLLQNGMVLMAGGRDVETLASSELYNPATGTFAYTGTMGQDRYSHTATLLNNGRVLIAGGYKIGTNGGPLSSAEIYDPATGLFTPTGAMGTPRVRPTATILPDGRVLIVGGINGPDYRYALTSAEIYDPATGLFTPTGYMSSKRDSHTAVRLDDGNVLVVGGYYNGYRSSAEVYNSVTMVFSTTVPMNTMRSGHTAIGLTTGEILVAGGGPAVSSAEVYRCQQVTINFPPTLDPIGPKSVSEGTLLFFSINGSDRDSVSLTYSANGLPDGASFDPVTKSFSWTPGYTHAGVYNVTFTVSDGVSTDSEVVEIQVSNTNRAPILDPIINQYGFFITLTGNNIEFYVSGSDPDGDPLEYSVVETLPAGADFNPATNIFSWTPDAGQSGIHTLTFMVSDGGLTDQRQVSIKVLYVNLPVGSNMQVSLDNIDLTFPDVFDQGTTWVNIKNIGPEVPPGLWVGYPPNFYYIHTTADFTGPLTLGIRYRPEDFQKTTLLPVSNPPISDRPFIGLPISDLPINDLPISDLPISDLPISGLPISDLPISDLTFSDLPISDLSALRLFHYENGQWVDVTTSHDMVNHVIYGQSDILSPFVIMIEDTVPPVVSAEVSPQANSNGWHNQDVTVTFDCSDLESGIDFCPAPVTVVSEGMNQMVSGTAVDMAGNIAASSVTINLDKTPPSLTCPIDVEMLAMGLSGTPATYAGLQPFLNGASAVDNLDSSVAITTNVPGTFPIGQTLVTFTANDDAGNQSSCQAKVTVISPKANSNGSSSYFSEGGYNAYATFDVKYAAGSVTPSGNMTFTSSRYRRKVVSTGISSLTVTGKTAVFTGPCTVNGVNGYNLTATVLDNATPGSGKDTFAITVTGPNGFNYLASGTVVSGDYNVSK